MSGAPLVRLPLPERGRWAAEDFVQAHLVEVTERREQLDDELSSPAIRGGQRAADAALARLTVDGYGRRAAAVYPQPDRGSTMLSPWIRHGLLTLGQVWTHATAVAADPDDLRAFHRSLLRQEYARHLYARLGSRLVDLAPELRPEAQGPAPERRRTIRLNPAGEAGPAGELRWDRTLGCMELTLDELTEDGWLPDPARRWLATYWTSHLGHDWRHGESFFFRHLIDGSRAASLVGWLQLVGALGESSGAFSRWEVEAQAPGLCASCDLVADCPIERAPAQIAIDRPAPTHALLTEDPDLARTAGPDAAQISGQAEMVWLTGESLGHHDPALVANPDLPAVFVFDAPLLAQLRLSTKRLVFMAETLAELAETRPVELWLGDPVAVLAGRRLAATHTPVPGWHRRAAALDVVSTHPWPWLRFPDGGTLTSFTRWEIASRTGAGAGARGDRPASLAGPTTRR